MGAWRIVGIASLTLVPGCREPNPDFDEIPASSASGSASSDTTATTTVPATTLVTDSATSMASADGTGSTSSEDDSTGGEPTDTATTGSPCEGDMCLVDRGVITRYFLDGAAPGEEPLVVHDAIEPPLDLFMTHGPALQFIEEETGRGLDWSMASQDSRASIAVDGSKLVGALEGSTTATIELVVRMMQVDNLGSRISHIGEANERGRITLSSISPGVLEMHWQQSELLEVWNVGATLVERHVVHAVLDTDAPEPSDRARLYIDGELIPSTMEMPPTRGRGITLDVGRHYVLGNREIGGRTFQGTLFYSALYRTALTLEEIQSNVATLEVNDDSPRG